uniref:Uncharacterized protein n=1 Tax=Stomoxys calcitrans TaxID=35570 RepID=A0A2Y9D4S3_STOCA
MNFLNIFVFVAVILAAFTAQTEGKRKGGGGGGNRGHAWRAGSHVAGAAVQGVAAEAVRQVG